ncbi:MAG TPA: glutathione S-transferase [Burkholderiales bacterium]|jgi:glutathione S-transferase|nr:glutathione S-transferase [Burkholderiales bacterium]
MAEYLLYGFAQSGNSYKPALALELAGADWKPRFVDFFNGETRTPAYREINVMGEVPVLEHQGRRLSQSGVILDYLAGTLGRFGGRDDEERREILRWLLWDNHKLTSYTATFRFLNKLTANPDPAVLAEFRKRAQAAWKILDTHLAGRAFVAAGHPTIADLSLCGYLFFDEELGVDWKTYPNIDAWLARLRALPRWKHPYDLLPGHPLPVKAA